MTPGDTAIIKDTGLFPNVFSRKHQEKDHKSKQATPPFVNGTKNSLRNLLKKIDKLKEKEEIHDLYHWLRMPQRE